MSSNNLSKLKMQQDSFFVYSWHIDDSEKEVTCIRAYGLNKDNENVCIQIEDFTPYVYMELPPHVDWTETKAQLVANKLDEIAGKCKPLTKCLIYRKKLYFAYLNQNNQRKEFPYLFLSFSNKSDINQLIYRTKKGISVPGVGFMKVRLHENDASPVLQLTCTRDIPTAGWISFRGNKLPDDEKNTFCTHEYLVKWKNLNPMPQELSVVKPLIMSYDLEVYSIDPNKMPVPTKPKNVIFQISCVFGRSSDHESTYEKYLLSLGEPDPDKVGEDVNVFAFLSEGDLISGFVDIIHEKQPNIIAGYNIFTFDIPYTIERAKFKGCFDKLQTQGLHKYKRAMEKTIKWSSSAYKNQEFQYLDAEGRLYVDLLPLVRRDYKMDSYSLKNISTYFLGETKDPLTPKGIFKCYEIGMKGTERGAKALGIVGKYCVQDSALVLKLFDKLQTWFGLSEMASICNVPIFSLYTQGQQIKVFSQIYKKCMDENVCVDKPESFPQSDGYQGALVYEPIPGVYDCVVPFDFSSLYPSIIIAYNIDYSTFVEDDNKTIPDSACHIVDFESHVGCEHDKTVRKCKPKHILCAKKRYRYLKSHKGMMPTLLEDLLSARKKTKNEMKEIEKKMESCTEEEKKNYKILLNVLEKRQLAYKVSANSGYGAMGVQRGYLPFMENSEAVTAIGRQSILKVFDAVQNTYKAKIILSDTDSVYCVFEHLKNDTIALWDYCETVAKEISALFPKPMSLAFEEVIYFRLLTLTKKRYMSLKCDKFGKVNPKVEKKGVLLSRRDNSNFVRTVYQDVVMKIFNRKTNEEIIDTTLEYIQKLMSGCFNVKDFIITKSVGSIGSGLIEDILPIPGKSGKSKFGDYTVPTLAEPGSKKYEQQMTLKNCETPEEYYLRCLPAQVQLAEKIRKRGGRVDVGTRLEFLILDQGGPKAKQFEKIESVDYYKENSSVLRIDFFYYLKALVNALDQVFDCTLLDEKGKQVAKGFTMQQYKICIAKKNMLSELKKLFEPKLEFVED